MMKSKKVIKGGPIKVKGVVVRNSITGKATNNSNPVTGRRPTKGSKKLGTIASYSKKRKK